MAGEEFVEAYDRWRAAASFVAVGLVLGTLLGAGSVVYLDSWILVFDPGATTALLATDGLTPSRPGSSLRVIQAVGLLLPLFVALLNVVVDPASEFDVDLLDRSLLVGIGALVIAGGFAVVAGFFSDLALVLKLSLLCLLVVFTFIGNAAVKLLPTDGHESKPERGNDDETLGPQSAGRDAEAESEPDATDDSTDLEPPADGTDTGSQSDDGAKATDAELNEDGADERTENGGQQL